MADMARSTEVSEQGRPPRVSAVDRPGALGSLLRLAALSLLLLAPAGWGIFGPGRPGGPQQTTAQEMAAYMQAHAATGNFMGSVLVALGEEVIHSQGYGMANLEHQARNTPETIFRVASLTKSFTAAAILQLQDQGLLDVDDTVARYLPDFPQGQQITIHQLLNHTAGIPDYEYFPDTALRIRQPTTLDDLIGTFAGLPLEFTPGSQYAYSNSGYALLAQIVEVVSGRPYSAYLAEQIFQPLGMADTGSEDMSMILPHQAAGYVRADDGYRHAGFVDMSNLAGPGGLYSTVLDLYKWDRALTDGTLMSAEATAAYFTPSADAGQGLGYAYGWGVAEMAGRRYILNHGHMPGFDTFALRYSEEELYVVVLGNLENANTQAVALGLAAIALGDPYDRPGLPSIAAVDPAIYESYVGRYRVNPDLTFAVTTEGDRLFLEVPDQPQMELFPESDTAYFIKEADLRLQFQLGTDGFATGATILEGGQEYAAAKVD